MAQYDNETAENGLSDNGKNRLSYSGCVITAAPGGTGAMGPRLSF
jgi:hypothetical protein